MKQAAEQLAVAKRILDRDIEVLAHIKKADGALVDPMQPSVAVEEALEQVQAARRLDPEFLVAQGVLRMEKELEAARRSPGTADFARLRANLRESCLAPAARLAARNGARVQEETLEWIAVQELVSNYLRMLIETSAESLRAAQY